MDWGYEKIKMIEQNNSWQLMDMPQYKAIIGFKWLHGVKYNEDGSIQMYKVI